jgi:hypothetical protein
VATKVPQARSHSFFIEESDNAIVLVSPNDRTVADVIRKAIDQVSSLSKDLDLARSWLAIPTRP